MNIWNLLNSQLQNLLLFKLKLSLTEKISSFYIEILSFLVQYSFIFDESPTKTKPLTPDPARDGGNWWNYCRNNPLVFLDPDGRIQIPVVGNYLMQDMKWRKTVIKGDTYTMGSAGCAVMVTADFLGISPLIVNTKYVDNGDVNWNKVASDNGYETTGRVDSSFTKDLYKKQNNDTTKEYSTFINVNFDDSNHDHYVGVQGVITLDDKDYMIITPTSINDRLTTYDAATYLDGTKGNPYYPQSRADKGWRVIDGKVCIPTDQIKAYVNFTKDIVNE